MKARQELLDALARSRIEELDEEYHAYRPARRFSLLLSWLGGWLRARKQVVIDPLPTVGSAEVGISYAGHVSVLLRYASVGIAINPVLARRAGPLGLAPRVVEPGLRPADFGQADLILITHAESSHLDLRTLRCLPRESTVIVPPRCAALVGRIGFARIVELGIGYTYQHRDVEIEATSVRNDGGRRPACAYVIRGDGPSVFYCGGSGYCAELGTIGRKHHPDIAILPIGGYLSSFSPFSFRSSNLSPPDALYAFEDLSARMLIPIHWGTFALSYESFEDPLIWLRTLVARRRLEPYLTILEPGRSAIFRGPCTVSPK
ncbi:MAG: MBL fold metallo-hydrolase [Pseudomonadota bacterium]